MELYENENPDEIGIITMEGVQATVLMVDDSAFTIEQPFELVEGAEDVFVLVRRSVVDAAAMQMGGMELGEQIMEGARSVLATWKVLSE